MHDAADVAAFNEAMVSVDPDDLDLDSIYGSFTNPPSGHLLDRLLLLLSGGYPHPGIVLDCRGLDSFALDLPDVTPRVHRQGAEFILRWVRDDKAVTESRCRRIAVRLVDEADCAALRRALTTADEILYEGLASTTDGSPIAPVAIPETAALEELLGPIRWNAGRAIAFAGSSLSYVTLCRAQATRGFLRSFLLLATGDTSHPGVLLDLDGLDHLTLLPGPLRLEGADIRRWYARFCFPGPDRTVGPMASAERLKVAVINDAQLARVRAVMADHAASLRYILAGEPYLTDETTPEP